MTFKDVLDNIISRKLKITAMPVGDVSKEIYDFIFLFKNITIDNGYIIIPKDEAQNMLNSLNNDYSNQTKADFERTLNYVRGNAG